jgi:hypothetical protein
MVRNDRRNVMKGVAAASGLAAFGATGSAAASDDDTDYDLDTAVEALQTFSDTLTWEDSGMQGSANARLCCRAGSEGVWNWNLTGGGSTFVDAELTVEFDDGETDTVDAEFPGVGNVAQFAVVREYEEDDCFTVVAAEAEFTLAGPPRGNQVLTITSAECIDGVVPPEPPTDKKERKKHEEKYAKLECLRKKLIYEHRKEAYEEAKREYEECEKK